MESDSRRGSTDTLILIGSSNHKPTRVSFLQLFRYTSKFDKVLMLIGSIVAIGNGLATPLRSHIMGGLSQSFINFTTQVSPLNATDPAREKVYATFHDEVTHACVLLLILTVTTFVSATIQEYCFLQAGENLVHRLRKKFIRAVMRQDIAWFDTQKAGALTTQLFSNLERVKEGTGDHIGHGCQQFAMFIGGYAICFYNDWRLTLIGACLTPIIAVWGYWDEQRMAKLAADELKFEADAGALSEQALSSMRTVMAFNGQQQECERYETILKKRYTAGLTFSLWNAMFMGMSIFLMFTSFGITVWFGTDLIYNNQINGGVVITIFLTIFLCIAHLDRIAPIVNRVNKARGAAEAIYEITDRVPDIDAYSKEGQKPVVTGKIELQDVRFNYPSRPDVPVLKGIGFNVEPGQTIALVGASGSGKSTIAQLVMRYYDPTHGRILIDGVDVDQFNVEYLRKTIGIVSQEPVLFNTTIEENIRFGNHIIQETEIWAALKKANAYDFVKEFPEGLQTTVGDRGTQLSGGQKQRIAIARALVRDPRILILDEATSALDADSERIVQSALENASIGRTTIVIAHRLSTVQNADKILAMKNGEIFETGTHDELLAKQGLYYDLVNSQVFVDIVEPPVHQHLRFRSRSMSSEGVPQDHARLRMAPSGIYEALVEEDNEENDEIVRLKAEMAAEGAEESTIWRIMKEARPEWRVLSITFVFSVIEALVYPLLSFAFTELIRIYSSEDRDYMLRSGHLFSFAFVGIGATYGFTQLAQLSLFGKVAESLTKRLRMKVFTNLMRMDAAYFDKPSHSAGKLVTRLATDATNIKPAINDRLGLVITEILADVVSISAAFYFGWQMTFVVLPLFPLVGIVWTLRGRLMAKRLLADAKELESCGKIAIEAIENMRTVQALTLQHTLHEKFCKHLEGPMITSRQKAVWESIVFGTTTCAYLFLYAITYRAGLWLIYHDYADTNAILRSVFLVSFASGSIGTIGMYYPDYIKAKLAAGLIFKTLDQKPEIDGMSNEGSLPLIEGNIKVKEVHFTYPERPDTVILKGLDLNVTQGQTVALVGASGCGKSTLVSLLERLYDAKKGEIEIDGCNLSTINPKHLRSHISIVSQEPILFDMSIKENILYGLEQSSIPHIDVVEAAKKANIHDFISTLPEAYNTLVGDKGTKLSGGQKQRIAIARALVRNPKILLLDEATSALDAESEKQVQLALERAATGRSCIVVAHRLSTIVNADVIAVVKDGRIVEKGTHHELLSLKGVYWSLTQKQKK